MQEKLEMEGIRDDNLLQILGIMETRVQQYIHNIGSHKARRPLVAKNHGQAIRIVPPNTKDHDSASDDSDDDALEPVSHRQLLQELQGQTVRQTQKPGKRRAKGRKHK